MLKGINGIICFLMEMVNVILCIQMDDMVEDRVVIQVLIKEVMIYLLSQFDGKMKIYDYLKLLFIGEKVDFNVGEMKWVIFEKFFDQFENVLNKVLLLLGEEVMYV